MNQLLSWFTFEQTPKIEIIQEPSDECKSLSVINHQCYITIFLSISLDSVLFPCGVPYCLDNQSYAVNITEEISSKFDAKIVMLLGTVNGEQS